MLQLGEGGDYDSPIMLESKFSKVSKPSTLGDLIEGKDETTIFSPYSEGTTSTRRSNTSMSRHLESALSSLNDEVIEI